MFPPAIPCPGRRPRLHECRSRRRWPPKPGPARARAGVLEGRSRRRWPTGEQQRRGHGSPAGQRRWGAVWPPQPWGCPPPGPRPPESRRSWTTTSGPGALTPWRGLPPKTRRRAARHSWSGARDGALRRRRRRRCAGQLPPGLDDRQPRCWPQASSFPSGRARRQPGRERAQRRTAWGVSTPDQV